MPTIPQPKVKLYGISGERISFLVNNGTSVNDRQAQILNIPHLVLLRNGTLTEPQERTLAIEVSGIKLPPSGAVISLEVTTHHPKLKLDGQIEKRILVWQESKWISNPSNWINTNKKIVFRHEFSENLISNGQLLTTPTDYFHINIRVTDDEHPNTKPFHLISQDYAFLMENQWLATLPQVLEDTQGAAPNELIVYYCDMFFLQTIGKENISMHPRERTSSYLQTELIPAMQEAFRIESMQWGFPWYAEWSNYRMDEPAKRLRVALTNDDTWYHGPAPAMGLASISLNLQSKSNASFNNLTESLMSNFYHELFHNLQRNINQHLGGNGDVDGVENAWQFITEGTAVLASSVGQPGVQFTKGSGLRTYLRYANGYLAGGGSVERDLNKSYQEIYPYHAAIYWRFLYECCGGMSQGIENPIAGMQVIRNALNILYTSEIVDIQTSTGLIEHLPRIMDEVIKQTANCPFGNYQDSLNQFARAIYSLQLENGRCLEPGLPQGCGLFDPAELYLNLPIPKIYYSSQTADSKNTNHQYQEKITHSFGIDFVEIELDPSSDGKPLLIELNNNSNSRTSFHMQIILLKNQKGASKPQPISGQTINPGIATPSSTNDELVYSIPRIELSEYDRLGLIITRVDNNEISGESGEYTLQLSTEIYP